MPTKVSKPKTDALASENENPETELETLRKRYPDYNIFPRANGNFIKVYKDDTSTTLNGDRS